MKFTISKTELLTALSITGKAVADNIIEACGMYQFSITPESLTVSANNMRQQITVRSKCTGDFTGSYLFPANELISLIKSIPEQPVIFEITQHLTTETTTKPAHVSYSSAIIYGKGKANLPLEPGDDFPEIKCDGQISLVIPADDFNEGIYRTLYACSNDELRPVFTGILIELINGKIRFSGCDTNVLSTCIFDYSPPDTKAKIIIPKNGLKLIQDLNPTGDMSVSISKSAAQISFNGIEVKCLLIDEKPVEFKQIIPTDNHIIASINKDEILLALNRAAIFCNKFNNMVQLNIGKSSVLIKGEDTNYSRYNIEDVVCESNDEIIIGTNINWLISSIQRVTTTDFWISFKANNKAMVITEYEPVNGIENLILIMPLWVK